VPKKSMTNYAFQPRFIFESELGDFGLPARSAVPNIMSLVDGASSLIDETCGRQDTDGNGSLVYTTYTQRYLIPEGRNLLRLFFRPLATVDTNLVAMMSASGQNYYTGCQATTIVTAANGLSPIISCSGRYGYSRRASQQVYPDLNYGANILQIASFFGGPPAWTPIDVTMIDFDSETAELWVPAGLYLSQYTEIVVTYNSGFNPFCLPRSLKNVCAMVVRNFLARGGGTTGLKSLSTGRVRAEFTDDMIDPTVERMLRPFFTVVGY